MRTLKENKNQTGRIKSKRQTTIINALGQRKQSKAGQKTAQLKKLRKLTGDLKINLKI